MIIKFWVQKPRADAVNILDPSDKFRPEKPEENFRDFSENCDLYNRVKKTYYTMHTKQTLQFSKAKVRGVLARDSVWFVTLSTSGTYIWCGE